MEADENFCFIAQTHLLQKSLEILLTKFDNSQVWHTVPTLFLQNTHL